MGYEAKCPTCKTLITVNLHGPQIAGTKYDAYCPKCQMPFYGTLIPLSPEPPKSPEKD